MATIQLTTTNYNGESGNVNFYPCNSGGTNTNLGTMTFPTEIVDTENYEGTYQVQFTGLTSGNNEFCYVQIPCSDCSRPTGLTTTELFFRFAYTDGPNNGQENTFFTYTALDVCNVLDDYNNNLGFFNGSFTSQIGPDNTVYETEVLGDCSTVSDGIYVIIENGSYVIREVSNGILDSTVIDCFVAPTDTPTPTPTATATLPTATPTPTGAPLATDTPTPTPQVATATPTPTPEAATATPTPTPEVATATPTPTGAPLATDTPTPTPEPPTATPTPTPTPTATSTPQPPTATPTPTPTPLPQLAIDFLSPYDACSNYVTYVNVLNSGAFFFSGSSLCDASGLQFGEYDTERWFSDGTGWLTDGTYTRRGVKTGNQIIFNESCTLCTTPTPTPTPTATATPEPPTPTPTPTATATPTPTPCPQADQFISQRCDGTTLMGLYTNGSCGTYEIPVEYNSPSCGFQEPTVTPTPTATSTPIPEATVTPTPTATPTPTPVEAYTMSGYGTTDSEACSNASLNPVTLYSNCASFEFGAGCTVYTDTFPNPLYGQNYVFINTSLWNMNAGSGIIIGLANEQC